MRFFYFLAFIVTFTASLVLGAAPEMHHTNFFPWSSDYQKKLMTKVGQALPEVTEYPFFAYPNKGYEMLPELFPEGKVLVFGYGSLMNKLSATRSIKEEAIETMFPVVAFGVKRLFNYKAKNTSHWNDDQNFKERAMLNLSLTFDISSMANGVAFEADIEDLANLVSRETGYDLVPVLVASWDDVVHQKGNVQVRIAYTFVAPGELRNHVLYTSTEFYPVRGYLKAVQEASKAYGDVFADMWNQTTFLGDGTTKIEEWDGVTFDEILSPQQP